MAERSARLTGPAELVAYLTAQAAASVWNLTANVAIVDALVQRGHRDWLWAMLALSIATAGAALLLFLFIRWQTAKAGKGQRRRLTDLQEISAYLLAQAIGFILWAFVVNFALSSLYDAGVRNLAVGIGMYVVMILVELLIFLFLRRAMTPNPGRAARGGAAGFGFGLAFAAWVIVALTIGSDTSIFPGTSMTERLPWLFDVCVAASLAAWAGGSAAYALTGFLQSRPWRAASMTIITPCIGGPAAALLVMGMWYGACAGQVTMGWAIRTGAQRTIHAVTAGGVSFGVACLLATLLWSFYYLRPPR